MPAEYFQHPGGTWYNISSPRPSSTSSAATASAEAAAAAEAAGTSKS